MATRSVPRPDRKNPSYQQQRRPGRAVSKLASAETLPDLSNPRTGRAVFRKKSKAAERALHEVASVIPIGELGENNSSKAQEDNGPGGHDAEPAHITGTGKEEVELQGGNDESQMDDDVEGASSEFGDDGEDDENEEEEGGNLEALGEGFYEVEAVRRKRVRKGQAQYLIKWRGWPESANTWEPFDNVQACADIIEEFEKSLAGKQTRRGRGKRKFGTYLLPQKKQRSIPYDTQEGGAASLGGNAVEDEEDVKKSGSEPLDISRESPEGLGHPSVPGEDAADSGRKTSQRLSNSKELDGSVFDCRLGNDQEVLQEKLILTDACHLAGTLNASGNQQEPKPGSSSVFCSRADVSPSKQRGTSSPFVGEEAASEDCEEQNVQDSTANSLQGTNEELMMSTGTGCSEQQLSSEVVVPERKSLGKEIGPYSSSSCPGEITSGEAGGDDKCIGAKERKRGFVRRVRQSLDSRGLDTKPTLDEENLKGSAEVSRQGDILKEPNPGMEEGRKDQLGAQLPEQQIVDPMALAVSTPTLQEGSCINSPACSPPLITKIIKAVNHSNAPVNGKQDVTVLFKALRADGEEVLVDNKFMRANYPILLIEFYEQHLRYSPSTAM